jgi:hypothetical protein
VEAQQSEHNNVSIATGPGGLGGGLLVTDHSAAVIGTLPV